MNVPKLWQLIKSTLIEKDGSTTTYGSVKRWAAWILLFLVSLVVIASLIPSGSLHLGSFLNVSWHHIKVDMGVLSALLSAIGTYILGGAAITQISNTFQNYHNVKYGNNTPDAPPPAQPETPAQPQA